MTQHFYKPSQKLSEFAPFFFNFLKEACRFKELIHTMHTLKKLTNQKSMKKIDEMDLSFVCERYSLPHSPPHPSSYLFLK